MLAKLMGLFLLGLIRLLTGAQARWQGRPPKAEQRIYFANHQSHADLVLMWAALPAELRSITRPIAVAVAVAVASLVGGVMSGLTPFKPAQAVAMAFIACVAGSLGHLVMKALKRDRFITNWGSEIRSVTGATGLLDRVDARCFAAPVFFHPVRWYFGL